MKVLRENKKILSLLLVLAVIASIVVMAMPVPSMRAESDMTEFDISTGWSYKMNLTEPSSMPDGGLTIDGTWTAGAKLPIGFGGNTIITDALQNGTTVDPGNPRNCGNLVLQRTVQIDNIAEFTYFSLDAVIDDGGVLFVNGKEAALLNARTDSGADARYALGYRRAQVVNVPMEDATSTDANSVHSGVIIEKSLFKQGENVITLLLLNDSLTSSDIYGDLKLYGLTGELGFRGEKFVMTPGKDETEVGFTWYSPFEPNPDNIYFLPSTSDEDLYITQKQGQINSKGGRFHDGNNLSIYKIPLNPEKASATLRIDICQNYTIELSGDGVTWNDVYPLYADPALAGVGGTGEQNRHWATFDLAPYLAKGSTDIYFRVGDQTKDNGWGGIVYAVNLVLGDSAGTSGETAIQIKKTTEYNTGGFQESDTVLGSAEIANPTRLSNKVTATGLEPNTEYTYRYGNPIENDWSEVYSFTTGNNSGHKIIFVGDPQIGAGNLANDKKGWNDNMNKAIEKVPDAAFILSAGDNIETDGSEPQYEALFAADVIKKLPYAPSNGNHDPGAPSFEHHYNIPNRTGLGNTGSGTDYYFSYGNTLYIVLNSNNDNVAEHKQAMEQAIASHPDAKWRIVTMHFDVYGGGGHAFKPIGADIAPIVLRISLTPIFDELGIDLVLNGHDHSYARSFFMKNLEPIKDQPTDEDGAFINPEGIMYITGTSSSTSKFYDLVNGANNWLHVTHDIRVAQFSEVEITDTQLSVTTYRSDTMAVVDKVSIRNSATKVDLTELINNTKTLAAEAVTGVEPGQYPQGAVEALNAAIASAETVFNDDESTEEEIDAAFVSLTAALNAFNAQVILEEDPASSNPASSDPASSGPASSDPASSDPASSDPASSDPTISDPTISDPAGSDPAGSDPASVPENPPTGDNSFVVISVILFGLCAAGVVVTGKKNSSK